MRSTASVWQPAHCVAVPRTSWTRTATRRSRCAYSRGGGRNSAGPYILRVIAVRERLRRTVLLSRFDELNRESAFSVRWI